MTFILVLAAALPIWVGFSWWRHMEDEHGIGPMLWRWLSGQPLDGKPRTDATWFRRSQNITVKRHSVPWWHHQPIALRGAIRTSITAVPFAVAYGLLVASTATIAVLAALAAAVVGLGMWRLVRFAARWRHHRRYERPLRRALTPILGVPPTRLAITRSCDRVEIGLPEEFICLDQDKQQILQAVAVKAALEAPDEAWLLNHKDGKRPTVVLTKSEPPPDTVLPAAILPAVKAAAPHEVVMGIGKKGQVIAISVDNDSPHVGLSMGSGDGKSVTARNMATQLAYHGCLIMILDYKLISHMWARGLPNVSYAGTPAEIEAAMVWLKDEVTRRNQVALAGADVEGRVHADVGPRIFVICEELNATQNRLKAWWNNDMEMKGRSPGSLALDEVMFLGRQVLVNVLQIGQRLSVKATGSGDARENLGVLVFSDPTASAWKMLIGDRHALPPATGHRGRLQVVTKKEVRETQGALFTGQQARDFATSGTVAVPPAGMPCITSVPVLVSAGEPRQVASDQGNVVGHVALPPARPPGLVTLREAVDAQMFPTIAAARKYAQRRLEPAGAEGSAHLYRIADLAAARGES